MTGIVIDIDTGKEIHDIGLSERQDQFTKHSKSILEISTPDGRTVFSIGRLFEDSKHNENTESMAA